jgi:hypothetical protein
MIIWHAMFAVNLGPTDKKACIMVGLCGLLHVAETDLVEGAGQLGLFSCWKRSTICIMQLAVKNQTDNIRVT